MSTPRLNRQLILEAPVQVADGAGGYDESWSALGMLWAQIDSASGSLVMGQTVALSGISHQITVRAAPVGQSNRPIAGQRFRMGSRVFRIDAVNEADAAALYLTCQCQEEVAI